LHFLIGLTGLLLTVALVSWLFASHCTSFSESFWTYGYAIGAKWFEAFLTLLIPLYSNQRAVCARFNCTRTPRVALCTRARSEPFIYNSIWAILVACSRVASVTRLALIITPIVEAFLVCSTACRDLSKASIVTLFPTTVERSRLGYWRLH